MGGYDYRKTRTVQYSTVQCMYSTVQCMVLRWRDRELLGGPWCWIQEPPNTLANCSAQVPLPVLTALHGNSVRASQSGDRDLHQ